MASRHLAHLTLALAILAAGCVPPANQARPKASSAPATAGSAGVALLGPTGARLIGLDGASLVQASAAGLITQDGASAISHDGSSAISHDGSSIVSTDGASLINQDGASLIGGTVTAPASLIAQDGASLIGQDGASIVAQGGGNAVSDPAGLYRLAQAEPRPVKGAMVYLRTAAGKFVTDAKGQLLAARTDAQGRYVFPGVKAKAGLVAYVPLGSRKGQAVALKAFVPRDRGAATTNPDAVSTLVTAYVVDRMVRRQPDPGATLDLLTAKLDADTRRVAGAAVGGLALDADRLAADAAAGQLEAARAANQPLDAQLTEVARALRIGQVNLGAGRPATQVALFGPRGLAAMPDGTLYVGEAGLGRIRRVAPDGTVTTFVDGVFGQVRENYLGITKLLPAPDGSLYVASITDARVRRITPDGQVTLVAGNGKLGRATPGAVAVDTPFSANAMAFGPDGTLYLAEGYGGLEADAPPHVYALKAGKLEQVPIGRGWTTGQVLGIDFAPDGTLYALAQTNGDHDGEGSVWRLPPGGSEERVKANLRVVAPGSDLLVAPDGRILVSELRDEGDGQLTALTPQGAAVALAGGELTTPGSLARGPGGKLFLVDGAHATVQALGADGATTTVAGSLGTIQAGAFDAFALNGPSGLAFDAEGRLAVAETGGNRVVRFDGHRLETIAGSRRGRSGDGGPALQASMSSPSGLAYHGGRYHVLDTGNRSIRTFTPGGTIDYVLGRDLGGQNILAPGGRYEPADVNLQEGNAVAVDAGGLLYWSRKIGKQIARLAGGKAELVAGKQVAESEAAAIDFTSAFSIPAGPVPAAAFPFQIPVGLAFDAHGDLLVVDLGLQQVLRVSGLAAGTPVVQVVAGVGLAHGATMLEGAKEGADEGKPAKDALLFFPTAVAVDGDDIYVAEGGTVNFAIVAKNFSQQITLDASTLPKIGARVRKITKDGTIHTVAGVGSRYFADPKAPEDALVLPAGLAVSADHRLAISDGGANQVRILPAGTF